MYKKAFRHLYITRYTVVSLSTPELAPPSKHVQKSFSYSHEKVVAYQDSAYSHRSKSFHFTVISYLHHIRLAYLLRIYLAQIWGAILARVCTFFFVSGNSLCFFFVVVCFKTFCTKKGLNVMKLCLSRKSVVIKHLCLVTDRRVTFTQCSVGEGWLCCDLLWIGYPSLWRWLLWLFISGEWSLSNLARVDIWYKTGKEVN